MFDSKGVPVPWAPPDVPAARALLDELHAARRLENQAAARRVRACGELFEMRRAQRGESEDWALDAESAAGAEIAAALRISRRKAAAFIVDGRAMRRLPCVAAVFAAGDIDAGLYRTIVYRTELITDAASMAAVDARLAVRAPRWPSLSYGRLVREIDRIVFAADRDAVRRVAERVRDRELTVVEAGEGTADVYGRLLATDAHLLDRTLTAMAGTVCERDPRTVAQRRADALGALAAGAQRLMCRCGEAQCPAARLTPTPVVIHVVAEQAALDGRAQTPGYLHGADALIPAELLRELAATARTRSLVHPGDAPPESGYRPSRALADFVRARDLTCRAPGCDQPAAQCDLDHTVPYPQGPTCASNIKALCRFHHILKTFGGWRDQQLPDGTVVWKLPGDRTYVTSPGSALLFPALMAPTGAVRADRRPEPAAERTRAIPKRRSRTREQRRAQRVAVERGLNRRCREQRRAAVSRIYGLDGCRTLAPAGDDPPPPF